MFNFVKSFIDKIFKNILSIYCIDFNPIVLTLQIENSLFKQKEMV